MVCIGNVCIPIIKKKTKKNKLNFSTNLSPLSSHHTAILQPLEFFFNPSKDSDLSSQYPYFHIKNSISKHQLKKKKCSRHGIQSSPVFQEKDARSLEYHTRDTSCHGVTISIFIKQFYCGKSLRTLQFNYLKLNSLKA